MAGLPDLPICGTLVVLSQKEEEKSQEMLEWIMKNIDPQKSEESIKELAQKYPKK